MCAGRLATACCPPPAPRPFTRLRSGPWGTSCEIRTLCRACGVGPRGREPARPGVWLCACPCVVRVCLCTLCVCVIYVCLWYSVCGGCAGRVHVCVRCALAFAQQGHFLSPSAPPAPSASSVDGSSPGTCASRVSDPRPGQKSASAPRREGAGCFPGFKEERPFLSSTRRPPTFSWPEGVRGLGGVSPQQPGTEWPPAPWPPDDGRVRCPTETGPEDELGPVPLAPGFSPPGSA